MIVPKFLVRCFPSSRSKKSVGFFFIKPANFLEDFETIFAEKSTDSKGPAKEEQIQIKMPGLVHPDTMNEEGYFTQKAKQQLEELKRKVKDRPTLTNPEKQEN